MSQAQFINKRPKTTDTEKQHIIPYVSYKDTPMPYSQHSFDGIKKLILTTTPPKLLETHSKQFEKYKAHIIDICHSIGESTFVFLLQHSANDFVQKLIVLTYYTSDKIIFPEGTHEITKKLFRDNSEICIAFIKQNTPTKSTPLLDRIQNFADLIHNVMVKHKPNTPKLKISISSETNLKGTISITEIAHEDYELVGRELSLEIMNSSEISAICATLPDMHTLICDALSYDSYPSS